MANLDNQLMLDLYIRDYLRRLNLDIVADTFEEEANLPPDSVAVEGFLYEWWSIFWDVYLSRVGINPSPEQASISMPPLPLLPPQTSAFVQQNTQRIPQGTNGNYILPMPEMENLLSVVLSRTPYPTLNARDVEQFSRMQPSSSRAGSRRRVNNDMQWWSFLNQGVNIDTALRRPTTSVLPPPSPNLVPDRAGQPDAGSSGSPNSSSSDANS